MDLQTLKNVQSELNRFQSKLFSAIEKGHGNKGTMIEKGPNKGEIIGDGIITGTKEAAALERAAMDLKTELHKITSK